MIISTPPVIPTPTFNPPTVPFPDSHVPTNVLTTLLGREEVQCVNIFQCRTTTNVVLSCLTTIFACTWVALHLDTPSTNKSWWESFLRRFGWMILALLVPEAIAGKAMDELFDAKTWKDRWNTNFVNLCSPKLVAIPGKTTEQYKRELKIKKYDSHWTLTHGFLAGMGGIRYYDSRDIAWKFKPKQEHFEDPKMRSVIQRIGLISKDNIADKSKGDGITKFFVVLQTTWFIIQCLSRWATRLPVTELEVVTLAYAVLNIFIYTLWWHKPQSLSDSFRVFVEKDGEEVAQGVEVKGTGEEEEEEEVSDVGTGAEENMPILRHSSSSSMVSKESNVLSGTSRGGKLGHLPNKLKWIEPTRSKTLEFLFMELESFGSVVFSALSGTIFGALHLIPLWLSVFPSDVERKLWQVSAFYVAVAPLGSLVATFVIGAISEVDWLPNCFKSDTFVYVLVFCAIGPYAIARVILLVLPFTTLRSLPTEAFRNVEWTRFIPHF